MAKFAYNNVNNASTSHTPLELNYYYHPYIFFKDKIDIRSKSHFINKLA